MIIGIGTAAQVSAAATKLAAVLTNSLLTIERVRLCKNDGRLFARPQQLPPTDDHGRHLWQKLMVHTSEASHHEGVPIHRALVHRLMQSGRRAERPPYAASGGFMATAEHTETSCFGSPAMCR
ncbi:hypothetical protein I551_5533 [Mycobacterium ulcerans str. Harvey]|uniref:Uncharacterized protein n=1 Tax=Mycobacterium ulcerans str. Harvey TaxID=1299332 RepID=A0ABP3A9A8_MYCUL|nr:hypothetical protein I551_5533 [Mycobacterium ulcerans str. Harvey]